MMEDRIRWLLAGFIGLLLSSYCTGQGKTKIVNNAGGSKDGMIDPRLGLVAMQLGLSPLAGYNEGGSLPQSQVDLPPQEYLPTGGAPPPPAPAPAIGLSAQVSPGQCQCVPASTCTSYKGNGNSYGGQQGGNFPVPPPPSGGQHGGNIPVIADGSGFYGLGGQQGGGGAYAEGAGGQHGRNIPLIGGGHAGSPNTDGSGLLDLRIVNRPPSQGGVQCLDGHVFCCESSDSGDTNPSNQGAGGSGGYATCGSRKIINVPGRSLEYGDAKFGAYPWMAVILGKGNNYVGAGAFISPYYVLTAAHKLKTWRPGTAMKVRFGEWNAKEDDEPYKNVEIEIESVTPHPGFNPQNLQNDVALVRLRSPVDVKSYPHIRSVCLPQKDYQYKGQRCWVAGFGKDAFGGGKHSYIMKEVDLPILDSNDCERRFRTTRLGQGFQLNRYSFLCAGGEEGKDACTGDGGSPLVCSTGPGGGWEVVGLVAWGVGCADYGIPGAYVNVPNYLDWINQEIYKY